jgi:hypothetical protein
VVGLRFTLTAVEGVVVFEPELQPARRANDDKAQMTTRILERT